MTRFPWLAWSVMLALPATAAFAQNPLPPIDPQQARLDQSFGTLDAPGSGLAYSAELSVLAAGSESGAVQAWGRDMLEGIRSGSRSPQLLHAHSGPVTALAARGAYLASAAADRKLILWALPDGKPLHTLAGNYLIRSLAFSPDGRLLAAGADDGNVALLEVPSLKPFATLARTPEWVGSLAFSPDTRTLAAGAFDGQVELWHIGGRQRLAAPPPAAKDPALPSESNVLALAWSPDGSLLAVGGTDARIHCYQGSDGKYLRSLAGHTGTISGLAFHPSGTVLASASKDRTVRLWNPANGQMLKALEGHAAWVQGVAFVAHGTRLASVGADRTLRLWDLTPAAKK